jgi:hypothetical protein
VSMTGRMSLVYLHSLPVKQVNKDVQEHPKIATSNWAKLSLINMEDRIDYLNAKSKNIIM